jgi:hypothetical protein
MKTKTEPIYGHGDPAAPKGSEAWADRQRVYLHSAVDGVEFDVKNVCAYLKEFLEERAWTKVSNEHGKGFLSFEFFVITPKPWGLGYPDYERFRAIVSSQLGKNYYDLKTVPVGQEGRPSKDQEKLGHDVLVYDSDQRTKRRLRAINRADALIRDLYLEGLVGQTEATFMGTLDKKKEVQVKRALEAVRNVTRNGDEDSYREKINQAIRKAFRRPKPTAYDLLCRAWNNASMQEKERFLVEKKLRASDA